MEVTHRRKESGNAVRIMGEKKGAKNSRYVGALEREREREGESSRKRSFFLLEDFTHLVC
jgi:hypothetical protein